MISRYLTITAGLLLAVLCTGGAVLAAGGPWSSGRQLPLEDSGVKLDQPVAVAIDREARRYYVVDAGSGQLVSFDNEGKFLVAFNAGGQLKNPVDMVKASSGSLWVIERSSNELLYINPRQKQLQRFSPKHPDGTALFPARLAVDGKDRLFVLDRMKGAILLLDDNLQVVQSFASKEAAGFADFRLLDDGLWALDGLRSRIYHFSLQGEVRAVVELEGLQFPTAFEIDQAGQFYLLDRHAGTVVVYGGNGGAQKFAFLGKGKRIGQLWNGVDLLFDWEGRLCVVDEGNGRVEVLSR